MSRKTLFAAALTVLLFPALAAAQDTHTPANDADKVVDSVLSHMPKQVVACQPHNEAQEAADTKLANEAWDLFLKHDLKTLASLQLKLEAAAAHAPNKPSLPEKCGKTLIIYSDNMMEVILASGMANKLGVKNITQHAPLPYARLDFLIGWLDVDLNQVEQGDDWYMRGLLNDPRDALLASEHANALSSLGRPADALAFTDRFLADNDDLPADTHAMMLRRRAYALGELGRYDEAIHADEESLTYNPKSEVAQKDLEWNKSQKAKTKQE